MKIIILRRSSGLFFLIINDRDTSATLIQTFLNFYERNQMFEKFNFIQCYYAVHKCHITSEEFCLTNASHLTSMAYIFCYIHLKDTESLLPD